MSAGAGGRGKVQRPAVVSPDAQDFLDQVFFDGDVRAEGRNLRGQSLRALRADREGLEARERRRREIEVEARVPREKAQPLEPEDHPAPAEGRSPDV